jgi:hypothetical protein
MMNMDRKTITALAMAPLFAALLLVSCQHTREPEPQATPIRYGMLPSNLGCSFVASGGIPNDGIECEWASARTYIDASGGGCATIPMFGAPAPAITTWEGIDYVGKFRAQSWPPIDGSVTACTERLYCPGTLVYTGAWQRNDGLGTCSVQEDSYCSYGASASLVLDASTPQMVGCCPSPCFMRGNISASYTPPPFNLDAGADVDAGDAGDAGDASDSGGSPPTLSALDAPLIASASGGGPTITLAGSNLTAATLTVCGVSATNTCSTSCATRVQFVMPSGLTAGNTTACGNIVATTGVGAATLTNALWVVKSNVVGLWYPESPLVTIATGISALTDAVGGVTVAQATGSEQPTRSIYSGGGVHPAQMAFVGSSTQTLAQSSFTGPSAPFGEVLIVVDSDSGSVTIMDSATSSSAKIGMTGSSPYSYAGGSLLSAAAAISSYSLVTGFFSGSTTSSCRVDLARGYSGAGNNGTNVLSGITFGGLGAGGSQYITGSVILGAVVSGWTDGSSGSTDAVWWHTFSQNFAGST